MVAALAAVITGQGLNASDAVLATLTNNLIAALVALTQSGAWCGTCGGIGNNFTMTPVDSAAAPTAYAAGQIYRFIAGHGNSGASTANVAGLGNKNIYKSSPAGPIPLVGGEISANNVVSIVYDGTQFQMMPPIDETPTTVLKVGTGAGDYTTASAGVVNVDTTNLQYTVVIPVGWVLTVQASGTGIANSGGYVLIEDSVAGLVQECAVGTTEIPWSLVGRIVGDGASHTINLQFYTNGTPSMTIKNTSSPPIVPQMLFQLYPSN